MPTTDTKATLSIPDFSLPASTGQTLSLDSFRGKVPLALVFVTHLDSAEDQEILVGFNERLSEFGAERSQVLAVVKDTARAVRMYSDERRLALPILADASGSMIRQFEAADGDGRARRLAVIADKTGDLVARWEPLPSDDGVQIVLDSIRSSGS